MVTVELMASNLRLCDLLHGGKVTLVRQVLAAGGREGGPMSFGRSPETQTQQDLIDLYTALAASDRPEELLLPQCGFGKAQRRGRKRGRVQEGGASG